MNNKLRKLWVDAGYRPNMGSAAVVPPPSKSAIRVYHVTAAEHGISSIALGRLKLSRFSDLNDPFELLALNFRERHVRKIIRDWKGSMTRKPACCALAPIGRAPCCGATTVQNIAECVLGSISVGRLRNP